MFIYRKERSEAAKFNALLRDKDWNYSGCMLNTTSFCE